MAEKRAARRPEKFVLDLPNGKKEFVIRTLVRREAMFVMHTTIRPVLQAVIEMASKTDMSSMKGNFNPKDMILGFKDLVDSADFETVESIAKPLFDQAAVDNAEIDFEEYFGQNPMELYPALYQALKLNYPDVFRVLQPVIDNASKMLKDQVNGKQPPAPPSDA